MEIPKEFEKQKELIQKLGFKLRHENYREFWKGKDQVHAEHLDTEQGFPYHFYDSFFRGAFARRKVRCVHSMLKGRCFHRGPVVCYRVKKNGSLEFAGIHEFKRCPKRKYERREFGVKIKKY